MSEKELLPESETDSAVAGDASSSPDVWVALVVILTLVAISVWFVAGG